MKYPNQKQNKTVFCFLVGEHSVFLTQKQAHRGFTGHSHGCISATFPHCLWWSAWTILASLTINFTRSLLQVYMVPAPDPFTEGHCIWPLSAAFATPVFDTCVFVLPECVAHLSPAISNLDVHFPSLFQFLLFIGKISGYFLDFDCWLMDWWVLLANLNNFLCLHLFLLRSTQC